MGGLAREDLNVHLATFLEITNTVKMNGVTEDVIKMRLFPFSLKDKARGLAVVFTARKIWFLGEISLEIPLQVFPTFQNFTIKGGDSLVSADGF